LAVVAAASAWSPQHVSAPIRHTVVMRSRTQRYPHMSEDPPRGPLQEAWARYVLIRPEYDMDALKNSTKLRTAKSWSWEDRTPGTARTIALTAVFITLFAIPALVKNPLVFSYLLEFATLSRGGIAPEQVWSDPRNWTDFPGLFIGALGELGRLAADTLRWAF